MKTKTKHVTIRTMDVSRESLAIVTKPMVPEVSSYELVAVKPLRIRR